MKRELMECQARVLSLEFKRDDVLERLEYLTAAIYSEIKRIEELERELGISSSFDSYDSFDSFDSFDHWDLDLEEDGLMA